MNKYSRQLGQPADHSIQMHNNGGPIKLGYYDKGNNKWRICMKNLWRMCIYYAWLNCFRILWVSRTPEPCRWQFRSSIYRSGAGTPRWRVALIDAAASISLEGATRAVQRRAVTYIHWLNECGQREWETVLPRNGVTEHLPFSKYLVFTNCFTTWRVLCMREVKSLSENRWPTAVRIQIKIKFKLFYS